MRIRDLFSRTPRPSQAQPAAVDVPSSSNPLDALCAELGEGWTYARTTEETSEGRVVILILRHGPHESFAARGPTTALALEQLRQRAEAFR